MIICRYGVLSWTIATYFRNLKYAIILKWLLLIARTSPNLSKTTLFEDELCIILHIDPHVLVLSNLQYYHMFPAKFQITPLLLQSSHGQWSFGSTPFPDTPKYQIVEQPSHKLPWNAMNIPLKNKFHIHLITYIYIIYHIHIIYHIYIYIISNIILKYISGESWKKIHHPRKSNRPLAPTTWASLTVLLHHLHHWPDPWQRLGCSHLSFKS